jgi:hypothetical protein
LGAWERWFRRSGCVGKRRQSSSPGGCARASNFRDHLFYDVGSTALVNRGKGKGSSVYCARLI